VFTDDVIDAYIDLKMKDVTRLRMTTHPVEFDMYYSL
jgi:glutamine synthetase